MWLTNRRDAPERIAVRRNQIADIARYKNLARSGLGDEFRVDSGIRARDEEGVRLLAFACRLPVRGFPLRIDLAFESPYSRQQAFT